MNIGIDLKYNKILEKIFEKHNFIDKVVIYGSRAKGNFSNRSDIDFVVYGQPIDRFELYKVVNEIEESSLPYNTDIQLISNVKNAQLLYHIDRVGKIFYQRKSDTISE